MSKTLAGDEQQDRIMTDSKTAAHSNALTGEELTVDLHPASMSDCPTQHVKNAPDVALLAEEAKDKLHTESAAPGKIRVVPVHRRPDLFTPCADLINSEWQRSQGARLHFLQKSCPEFPVSLVLLQGHREAERLLGHIRISRVIGHGSSLFVESVVVCKTERGKGYGRILMTEAERYARSRGFRRLCLTTHDKQHFYAHLGFVLSAPVQNAGSMTTFVPMETLLRFSRSPGEGTSVRTCAQVQTDARVPQPWSLPPPPVPTSILPPPPVPTSILPPPPPVLTSILPPPPPGPTSILPPPPPPPVLTSILPPPPPGPTSILPSALLHAPISMSTHHPSPPSVPIPPPPPPPPSHAGQPVVQTLTETPHRDAKGLPIFWMHKDI